MPHIIVSKIVVTSQRDGSYEGSQHMVVQMRDHNIWFRLEIKKIIIKYSLLSRALLLCYVVVYMFLQFCSQSEVV